MVSATVGGMSAVPRGVTMCLPQRAHACTCVRVAEVAGSVYTTYMTTAQKLLNQILTGRSDANIPFAGLRHLLLRLGFDERTEGSHHIFRMSGVEEMINLQKEGSKAKPYQVRQVRAVIQNYKLGVKV